MKYWFFNGSDVVGPFTPEKLVADKAFNENSLVCPEFFSDEEDHWQPALSFAEFKSVLSAPQESSSLTIEQEMDTLLQEKSPLSFEKTNTDNARLQLPKKPAKPGPIEEYFNHIEKEDLGDILGIPAPEENSDMDLAHALEHQLAKTSSTRREKQELTPLDDQTVQQLEDATSLKEAQETHHVSTATEVFATKPPLATPQAPSTASAPTYQTNLPVLPIQDFPSMPTTDTAPLPSVTTSTQMNTIEQAQTVNSSFSPVATFPTMPESAALTSSNFSPSKENWGSPHAAVLRTEKIEVNSINARLKQTQEMKDFLQTQTKAATHNQQWERISAMLLAATTLIVGALFALHQLQARPVQPTVSTKAVASMAQELLAENSAKASPHPVAVPQKTDEQQALAIVQNYKLPGEKGLLANYLDHIYHAQLTQGYVGTWEAQLLHKNTYLVKYRLTKTRKEPIIYIFQADVAQGKLTGALNNISLDLVGKIQS